MSEATTPRANPPGQPPAPNPYKLPQTVESAPERAMSLGWLQVEMGRLDNDPDLVRNGQSLMQRAQAVLDKRQGQTPKA